MTAHMHADENESVAWRLQRAWDRQAFSCRSIFIADAACRFWHVTGLVLLRDDGIVPRSYRAVSPTIDDALQGGIEIRTTLPG